MTHDDDRATNSDKIVAEGSGDNASAGLVGTGNNSVQEDVVRNSEADSCCVTDRLSQIDDDNGLSEPSLVSSYSSTSSTNPACRSSSSSSSSDTNCKRLDDTAIDCDRVAMIKGISHGNSEDSSSGSSGKCHGITKPTEITSCYNPMLDDEIRNRLDKLNSLSDLINSLELRFDQANLKFRETLKCSTERLSTIAKTLGPKSIRHGRNYHAARVSVEQSQSECQRACVQFEQANNAHQFAKEAIRDAELRLKQITSGSRSVKTYVDSGAQVSNSSFDFSDLCTLRLEDSDPEISGTSKYSLNTSDNNNCPDGSHAGRQDSEPDRTKTLSCLERNSSPKIDARLSDDGKPTALGDQGNNNELKIQKAAKLSEELNQAIIKLIDAEQKRSDSERAHFDQANKLMFAQERLTKLEREHGNSIRRSQVYFDEARQFNAKLDSVKSEIARISEEIIAAKKAYARTLNELEQFSEDLHINSSNLATSMPDEDD